MFGAHFHSFILAQVLGLYCIIVAIAMLGKASLYRGMLDRMSPQDPAISIGASFGTLLGLFLVTIHNIWNMEPRILITIISWVILIKSVIWLAFPNMMLNAARKMYGGFYYYIVFFIVLAFGILLLAKGYYLYLPHEYIIGSSIAK